MRQKRSTSPIFWAVLAIPVLYLAALLASGYEDGMTAFDLLGRFNVLLERPFSIRWTPHTLKFMLAAIFLSLSASAASQNFVSFESSFPHFGQNIKYPHYP